MIESKGRIIFLNGTSSSGKSTLANALRSALEPQFHYYASDQLAQAGFRPSDWQTRTAWREAFFHGFHRSIASFADVGLDLLVEHIVEETSWAEELATVLSPFDVFWVGVHAPVAELLRRERIRGDRWLGEAIEHSRTHSFCRYNVEVDTTDPIDANVTRIVSAWRTRSRTAARSSESL